MARRLSIASGIITALAAAFALLLALSVPALAHHKDGHDGGPSKTEDTSEATVSSESDDDDDNMHPSDKDRETNNGSTDDEQGNSGSDPDDDGRGPDRSNGGADKPGGPGGVDLDDQDGNNGCGNDDDFEDDNEGWCGRNPKRGGPKSPKVKADKDEPEADEDDADGTSSAPGDSGSGSDGDLVEAGREVGTAVEVLSEVLLADITRSGGVTVEDEVLGSRITKAPLGQAAGASALRGRAMPFTGSELTSFVALGVAVLALGYALTRLGRKSSV